MGIKKSCLELDTAPCPQGCALEQRHHPAGVRRVHQTDAEGYSKDQRSGEQLQEAGDGQQSALATYPGNPPMPWGENEPCTNMLTGVSSSPQELEMQARLHGLPNKPPTGLSAADLMPPYIKQETSLEENLAHHQAQVHHQAQHLPQNQPHPQVQQHHFLQHHLHHQGQPQPRQLPLLSSHMQPHPPIQYPSVGSSQPFDFAPTLDFSDGIPAFSDGMSGLGDLGGLDVQARRGELGFLMMDEPLSPIGGDPLLSAMSPEASVDSSRRSSFSIEDGDIL